MPEGFVPLATLLRGVPRASRERVSHADASQAEVSAAPVGAALAEHAAHPGRVDVAKTGVLHELALMRLASLEAFERGAHRMLRGLALDVLGRELRLAPVDIDALVSRALASLSAFAPVALVLSAADAERVRAPLPIRIDPQLTAGDLVIEVRDGSIESRFAFRLAATLEGAEDAV